MNDTKNKRDVKITKLDEQTWKRRQQNSAAKNGKKQIRRNFRSYINDYLKGNINDEESEEFE